MLALLGLFPWINPHVQTPGVNRSHVLQSCCAMRHLPSAICQSSEESWAAAGEMRPPLTVVLINNAGGGIFSFLPIASDVQEDVFTQLWSTPQTVDLAGALTGLSQGVRPANACHQVPCCPALCDHRGGNRKSALRPPAWGWHTVWEAFQSQVVWVAWGVHGCRHVPGARPCTSEGEQQAGAPEGSAGRLGAQYTLCR